MQACQFARFAVEGTSVQGLGHSVEVARRAQPAEAVAHALNFHLESLLFGQVIEGPYDALPRRASGLDRVLQVEVKPCSGLLGTAEQGIQKDAPLPGEERQDVCQRCQWTKLVAGIERRAFFEIAVQFQVGE